MFTIIIYLDYFCFLVLIYIYYYYFPLMFSNGRVFTLWTQAGVFSDKQWELK